MVRKLGDGALSLVAGAGEPEVEKWPRVEEPADASNAEEEPDRKRTQFDCLAPAALGQPDERDQRRDDGGKRPGAQYDLPYRPARWNVCSSVSNQNPIRVGHLTTPLLERYA